MNGTLTFADYSWPLLPSSLNSMRGMVEETWQAAIVDFLESWWGDDETIEVQTSGSTGNPRRLVHTKADMVESARRTIQHFALVPGTRAGLAMPVQFIGGMMMLVRAQVGGWDLKAVKPQAVPKMGGAVDFVALTPSQAKSWRLAHPREWLLCKNVLIGGGQTAVAWLKDAPEVPAVYEGFGMTETVSHFAIRQLHPQHQDAFQCLPGFAVFADARNALGIKLPNRQTLHTNDAAEVNDAQSFRWLGRLDDVVNSGGVKIHPESIEESLAAIIKQPFRCYGAHDTLWGQVLVLRIHSDSEPTYADKERARIAAWAEANLPRHHAPKRIEWMPLEITASGKWKRPRT